MYIKINANEKLRFKTIFYFYRSRKKLPTVDKKYEVQKIDLKMESIFYLLNAEKNKKFVDKFHRQCRSTKAYEKLESKMEDLAIVITCGYT